MTWFEWPGYLALATSTSNSPGFGRLNSLKLQAVSLHMRATPPWLKPAAFLGRFHHKVPRPAPSRRSSIFSVRPSPSDSQVSVNIPKVASNSSKHSTTELIFGQIDLTLVFIIVIKKPFSISGTGPLSSGPETWVSSSKSSESTF